MTPPPVVKPAVSLALVLALFCVPAVVGRAEESVSLESLDLGKMRQGWGQAQINRSIREKPLSIGGKVFPHGVGTHANSVVWIDLAGGADKFLASVGVDDAAGGPASVAFKIVGDGRKLWESGVMKPGQPAKSADVDLKGIKYLILMVGDAEGDLKAARANNALFFPVNPGHEEDSWKLFLDEAMGRFLAGTYAGTYEKKLIDKFLTYLPEKPPWKR